MLETLYKINVKKIISVYLFLATNIYFIPLQYLGSRNESIAPRDNNFYMENHSHSFLKIMPK